MWVIVFLTGVVAGMALERGIKIVEHSVRQRERRANMASAAVVLREARETASGAGHNGLTSETGPPHSGRPKA